MKLVIQIPCFNEAATLRATVAELPQHIAGIDEIEVLVVDDGSDDATGAVAHELGVAAVVRTLVGNRGLARAFSAGLDAALRRGADIVVNTDADGQYVGEDINLLVRPILERRADMVVGDRGADAIEHFSPGKRMLQRWGSRVVRELSGTSVRDAPSGFRAMSRECALRLVTLSDFSYTLETLIQAGAERMVVLSVPIRTRPTPRPSRLAASMGRYVLRSTATILRSVALHRPLRAFGLPAGALLTIAMILGVRFLYFHVTRDQAGHTQSLILAAICAQAAFVLGVAGVIADLGAAQQRLLGEVLYRIRRLELEQNRRGEE